MNRHILLFALLASINNQFYAAASSSSSDAVREIASPIVTSAPKEFFLAIKNGDLDQVQTYMLNGNDLHIGHFKTGITPIMYAAAHGQDTIVTFFLSLCMHKSDRQRLLSVKSKSGKCALDYAIEDKNEKVIRTLKYHHRMLEKLDHPVCGTYFSPNILDVILKCIDSEQKWINGAMYSFTHGDPARRLVKKHKKGIKIILNINKDYQNDLCIALKYMVENGISINIPSVSPDGIHYGKACNMHHKFLIFGKNVLNKPLLITGSCNFTDQAFNRNWENMIVTDDFESINAYMKQMAALIKQAVPLTAEKCASEKDTAMADTAIRSRKRNCVEDLPSED